MLRRAKAVLDPAAAKAGWGSPLPKGRGRGVSLQRVFGSYMAQVAEVEVAKNGSLRVKRVVRAVDGGSAVNPDTIEAKMQGAVIFGISAALHGEIMLKRRRPSGCIVRNTEAPGGMGGTCAIMTAIANVILAGAGGCRWIRTN